MSQAQLLESMLPILLVVDHYGQSVFVLVQLGASDDTQVVQRQAAELIDSQQDVPCHLSDGLSGYKSITKRNERKYWDLKLL